MAEKLVSIGETDAYVFATEGRMRRTQGRHVSCTVIETATSPDLDRLRAALAETMRRHPMLGSKSARSFPSFKASYVKSADAAAEIPLTLHQEPEQTLDGLLDFLINDAGPHFEKPRRCHVRMDALECADGTWRLILSWRHIVLDGVGAEWLIREIATLCEDPQAQSVAPGFQEPAGSKLKTMQERWLATKPMLDHLMALLKTGIRSLTPPGARIGRMQFSWVVLDEPLTEETKRRASLICGPLVQTPFFLACSILGHHAVWRRFRGGLPEQDVVALPVQERPRGKPGPIFRNNVSVMFLQTTRAEAESLESLTAALLKRQQQMMRAKLAESFAEMQRWMMVLPGPVYSKFLQYQMKGETTSFHHSHTGTFAGGLGRFAGADIANAWHIPGFYGPPGTGLFVGEHKGRMTVTASWRQGVLTREEAGLLRDTFIECLTGKAAS